MTRTSPGMRAPRQALPAPSSNVYTVMLVIAFAFVVTAVVFNVLDLVGRYGVAWSKALWPF